MSGDREEAGQMAQSQGWTHTAAAGGTGWTGGGLSGFSGLFRSPERQVDAGEAVNRRIMVKTSETGPGLWTTF